MGENAARTAHTPARGMAGQPRGAREGSGSRVAPLAVPVEFLQWYSVAERRAFRPGDSVRMPVADAGELAALGIVAITGPESPVVGADQWRVMADNDRRHSDVSGK